MLEIRPGVLGGIPRIWRLRVGDTITTLEGSPDEGVSWMPYLSIPMTPVGTTVPFRFVGPLAEADDKVNVQALGTLLASLNPGYKPEDEPGV